MSYPEDNKFNDVRRLLGCKRYEQPPPGYFISFSDRVIARIETEEPGSHSSWWSWLLGRFDAKPVLICAYGLAVSSLLFMGFRLSQVFDAELGTQSASTGPWLALTPGSPLLSTEPMEPLTATVESPPRSWFMRSASAELLFPANSLQVKPVSFSSLSQY